MSQTTRLVHEPTGERMIPESADLFTFWEHVYRYAFAGRFVKGKRVLDIACGEGYGSASLERAGAAHVTGVDVSETACLHARSKYGIDAKLGAAEKIPLDDASVDVIISFETIEHVPEPTLFLDECVRVLAPGGTLVISTPNRDVYGAAVPNPYHCSEMTEEEFTTALGARFHDCRYYTQRPKSAPWWNVRTFACDDTPWKHLRGFSRFRAAVQSIFVPEVMQAPTLEQRESVLDLIANVGKGSLPLFNPFTLRPHRSWDKEKPTYFIATATR